MLAQDHTGLLQLTSFGGSQATLVRDRVCSVRGLSGVGDFARTATRQLKLKCQVSAMGVGGRGGILREQG